MLERNNIIIAPEKSKDFEGFLKKNAKTSDFWRENKESISKPVDKKKLEEMFK